MKPFFIYESFETKQEHDDLTELIKNIIVDYRNKKSITQGYINSVITKKKDKPESVYGFENFVLEDPEANKENDKDKENKDKELDLKEMNDIKSNKSNKDKDGVDSKDGKNECNFISNKTYNSKEYEK